MRRILLPILALAIISCGDNDQFTYPRSFTYSHVEHSPEGLFLVQSPSSATPLDVNTGSYGQFRLGFQEEIEEALRYIFDIQVIELLSEDRVRLQIRIEEEEIDTVVSYTLEEGELIIQALQGSNLISYNSDLDQFELCAYTTFAIPGPNVPNPGQAYNQYNVQECRLDALLEDYLEIMLDDFEYQSLDTLGVLVTKFIYK